MERKCNLLHAREVWWKSSHKQRQLRCWSLPACTKSVFTDYWVGHGQQQSPFQNLKLPCKPTDNAENMRDRVVFRRRLAPCALHWLNYSPPSVCSYLGVVPQDAVFRFLQRQVCPARTFVFELDPIKDVNLQTAHPMSLEMLQALVGKWLPQPGCSAGNESVLLRRMPAA